MLHVCVAVSVTRNMYSDCIFPFCSFFVESVCERVKEEAPASTCTVENPNEAKQTSSIQKQTKTFVDPEISSSPILNGSRSTTTTTIVINIAPQPMMTVAGNHSKSPQTSTTPAATHSQSQLTNGAQTVQEKASQTLRKLFSSLIRVSYQRSPDIGKTVRDLVKSLMVSFYHVCCFHYDHTCRFSLGFDQQFSELGWERGWGLSLRRSRLVLKVKQIIVNNKKLFKL